MFGLLLGACSRLSGGAGSTFPDRSFDYANGSMTLSGRKLTERNSACPAATDEAENLWTRICRDFLEYYRGRGPDCTMNQSQKRRRASAFASNNSFLAPQLNEKGFAKLKSCSTRSTKMSIR
jgi:hypothetical protein